MKKFFKQKAIGLMSGSSLDGLDICLVELDKLNDKYYYNILFTHCTKYKAEWIDCLKNAHKLNSLELLHTNVLYAKETARLIEEFLLHYKIDKKEIDFISSHGHTVLHQPHLGFTLQICDGATLAKSTQIKVVSDLRAKDIAFGGQGAPIVPIADKYLFADYEICVNLGGIANLTIKNKEKILAYDICFANQALNFLASKKNLEYDDKGSIAQKGTLIEEVYHYLFDLDFHQKKAPKSLSNEWIRETVLAYLENQIQKGESIENLLHTCVLCIAKLIANELNTVNDKMKVLITGGGAYNDFLIEKIRENTQHEIIVPSKEIIEYKEALAMAFIGYLRIYDENNVLCSVTGASQDTSCGIIHQA